MSEIEVGEGGTRRVFAAGDGQVRAVGIVTAGRRQPVDDLGLRLVVDGRDVDADDLTLVDGPHVCAESRSLRWRLHGSDGLTVDVAVESEPGVPVVRTRLAVTGRGRLQRVEAERWRAPALGGVAAARELGQPLWGDGLFAALEHPGAENWLEAEEGGGQVARFSLPVDIELGADPYVPPAVVVGGAEPGQERSAFWDELDRFRAHPARLIVLANNWYQLGAVGRMDEATVRSELEGFAAVAQRHRLPLDWYCLDDPWDGEWAPATGLWGRMAPSRFPGGLPALQRASASSEPGSVAGVGLWVSPWGGYYDRHDARVAWGREHGYEIQEREPPWPCLCPAGDHYRSHLADAMTRWTAAGVGYWKLDGVQFDCQQPEHGHSVGPAGRTAQMDRFAGLLDSVRAVDPNLVLTFTTGSNPSPWWLRHADFVWRGGLDDDAPEELDGGRRERFATYIDGCLDALRHTAVPVSAIVTFSVVENQARAYRDEDETLEGWERHCWFLAGRGTHHHDLYVAPDSLSGAEWDALSAALAWARRNQRVLARSRMIGGRPQAGEPYGFSSTAEGQVILCLRNPSGRSQALTVTAADLGGTAEDLEPVWGRAALPAGVEAGGGVTVELEPFEVVLASGRGRVTSSLAPVPRLAERS